MQLFINGQPFTLSKNNTSNATIAQAIQQYFCAQQKSANLSFALALNGHFISKDDYATTELQTRDSIDMLFPIQGG